MAPGGASSQAPNVGTRPNVLVGVDVTPFRPGLGCRLLPGGECVAPDTPAALEWHPVEHRHEPQPGYFEQYAARRCGHRAQRHLGGRATRAAALGTDPSSCTTTERAGVRSGVPSFGTGDNVITSISAVSGSDVWAAGYFVEGAQHKTLTLHYDGTVWHRVPSANAAGGVTALRDIDASSPTSAWAVGLEYQSDRNRYVASTQHWDGTSWTAFPSAARASSGSSEMLGVAKAPGTSQVWAAGRLDAATGAAPWRSQGEVETICLSGSTTAPLSTQGSAGSDSASHREAELHPNRFDRHAGPTNVRPSRRQGRDAGISELTRTHGAVIDDFDDDEVPDIFLGRHGYPPRFYVNDGNGHFTETHKGTFPRQIATAATRPT